MLRSGKTIVGYRVQAEDGLAGSVEDLYFDDERLGVRFVVVRARGFLLRKRLLVSPIAFSGLDWQSHRVHARLSAKQIRRSPGINRKLPVSRQKEREVHEYYRWPVYWTDSGLSGPWPTSSDASTTAPDSTEAEAAQDKGEENHLRSLLEVIGYSVLDSEANRVGTLEDLLVEDSCWAIQHMVVRLDDRERILIGTDWIDRFSWDDRVIEVSLAKEEVESSPAYDAKCLVEGNRTQSGDSGSV
jgi:sporulation protein YlmC with PRC-barrel domain